LIVEDIHDENVLTKDGVKGILALTIHSDFDFVTGKVMMYLDD
jgi:hypothetical protein